MKVAVGRVGRVGRLGPPAPDNVDCPAQTETDRRESGKDARASWAVDHDPQVEQEPTTSDAKCWSVATSLQAQASRLAGEGSEAV